MKPNIEHVYISNEPIEIGRMHGGQKYKKFSALCIALLETSATLSPFSIQRRELSLKQHWHAFVKPMCTRCEVLQAMLRANVKKENRLTFDRAQFQTLIQQIESENQHGSEA